MTYQESSPDISECPHGDDCNECCADCFKPLDSHCSECGQCGCEDNECENEDETEDETEDE